MLLQFLLVIAILKVGIFLILLNLLQIIQQSVIIYGLIRLLLAQTVSIHTVEKAVGVEFNS